MYTIQMWGTYVQEIYTRENDILFTPNNFLAANIKSNLKLLRPRGPMQGGSEYFHDTTFRTQQLKHIFQDLKGRPCFFLLAQNFDYYSIVPMLKN